MLHHPVTEGATPARKALNDRRRLREVIARAGVELVIHGHLHHPLFETIATPTGDGPVIGGASASHAFGHGRYRPARYNEIAIAKGDDSWEIVVTIHELTPETGTLTVADQHKITRPYQTQ